MHPRAFVPVIALLCAGCGSDLTAPTAVAPLTLGGEWRYRALDLSGEVFGEDVDCSYGFDMTLTVTGSSFDGIYSDALMTCTLFGQSQLVDAGGGDIVGGSRAGTSIQFDVDTERVHNTGVLGPAGMEGQVSIELIVQRNALIDTILVTGAWNAFR